MRVTSIAKACAKPGALLHLLSAWAAVAMVIALIEGQPDKPYRTIHDPWGQSMRVPDPSGFRVPPGEEPYTIVARYQFLGFQLVKGQVNFTQIVVPWWFLICCLSLSPVQLLRSKWRRQRALVLQLHGICPICGYDLRATPNRCPECGHITEAGRRIRQPTHTNTFPKPQFG